MSTGHSFSIETQFLQSHLSLLSPDLTYMDRVQHVPQDAVAIDVFTYWILAFANFPDKDLPVRIGQKIHLLTGKRALFLPPFTLVEWHLQKGNIRWQALSSSKPMSLHYPTLSFPWNGEIPQTIAQTEELLSSQNIPEAILGAQPVSAVVLRTKKYIDSHFRQDLKIEEVARATQIPWATMTREFRKAFNISPISYRNKLRVMEAVRLMNEGRSVTDAFLEAGFSSPNRFIEQFSNQLGVKPKYYRPSMWMHKIISQSLFME